MGESFWNWDVGAIRHRLEPQMVWSLRPQVHADYEIMRLFAQEGLLPSENVSALCK